MLTVHEEDEYIIPIVRAGASGYLVKDTASSELLTAVKTLNSGNLILVRRRHVRWLTNITGQKNTRKIPTAH